jgi:hypothetical protein
MLKGWSLCSDPHNLSLVQEAERLKTTEGRVHGEEAPRNEAVKHPVSDYEGRMSWS